MTSLSRAHNPTRECLSRWVTCELRTGSVQSHTGALQTGSDGDGDGTQQGGGDTTRDAVVGGGNGLGTW